MSPRAEKKKVLWITNNAAPYRVPVWTALAEHTDLQIRLLQPDEEVRSESRRSEEWTAAQARSSDLDIASLRTYRFGGGERLYYALTESADELARSCDSILLGAWESPACWQLSLAAKSRGVRRVGFYESTRMSQRHQSGPVARARSHFFRSMDAVVVPGTAAADALLDLGVSRERIIEGFNAVDVERFAAVAGIAPLTEGHRFVYIGQLISRKNVAGLVQAFARCGAPDDMLDVAGDGEQLSELRSLAKEVGRAESIRFVGRVAYNDLPAFLSTQHTLVLPSHEEVWGLVVNEALAAGRHVVVSDRAGVAPSVRSMRGVFVSSPAVDDLVAAMTSSRRTWQSPMMAHEILQFTPRRFSNAFLEALVS